MNDKTHGPTGLPDARRTPRFAGLTTFCRYPRLEDVERNGGTVDWAIYGIPFDGGVTYRPGARFGPRAIRTESQYVKPYHIEHDVMLTEVMSLADAGDAPVAPYSTKESQDAACTFAAGLGDPAVTRLFAVGGDHSTALANMRATWERRGRPKGGLALIHFDSHLDTVDTVWGEKYTHASPFIRAIEEGIIDPDRMLSIGIKGPLNTPQDLEYAAKHGVTIVTYEQWRREGTATIDRFMASLGEAETYLTFDIDVVDPAYAPGTGTLSVGGFTSSDVLHLLRHLHSATGGTGINLVGADLVEVLPDRDPQGITAMLAAHVIFEILCLDGVRRG